VKKNILVTGGCGFIGTNLILNLIDKNYNVVNLDKYSKFSNSYLKRFKNKNYFFYKLDLASQHCKKKLSEIIKKKI